MMEQELTDAEWRELQSIAEQGHSHRHWIDCKIRERLQAEAGELAAIANDLREIAWDEGHAYRSTVPWVDDTPDPHPGNPYREHTDIVRKGTTSVNLRDLTDPAVTGPMKAEARADALASLARTKGSAPSLADGPTIDAMPSRWEVENTRGGIHGDLPSSRAAEKWKQASEEGRHAFLVEAMQRLDSLGFVEFMSGLPLIERAD